MDDFKIFNCHSHIFTVDHVPKDFLPFRLVRWLAKRRNANRFARFLSGILPLTDKDILDRYANFIEKGSLKSQKEIFEGLRRFYPEDTGFVALSMDMDYMEAGKTRKDFIAQIEELAGLKRDFPESIYPFICADPRRDGLTDLVKRYIEEKGFSGIKIYPPLGYYPFDERFRPMFEYAEKNDIPIISHCSHGGVYYRGKVTDEWLTHPKTGARLERTGNKCFCRNFADPDNYVYLLDEFRNLKICFGHFGGEEQWRKYEEREDPQHFRESWFYKVRKLLENPDYPNLYADISMTLSDPDLVSLLHVTLLSPKVASQVLYGSDYYMSIRECSEYRFSIELRRQVGEDSYRLIAHDNARRFLGLPV